MTKSAHVLILALLLITGFQGYSQFKDNTEYNIWSLKEGDTCRIYGGMANIRTQPQLTATLQDSLACGSEVVIISQEKEPEQVKGIYAPWVKVRYLRDHKQQEGYLWLGMLALGSFQKGTITFLYGIEKLTAANNTKREFTPATWFIRLKALNAQGTILDEKEMKMEGMETSVCSGKLLGDMGLENMEDIVRLNFGGEACGIPTYYYYYGWTGSKLIPLPGKMEVGDAGVFYHTETFLFPKEQGGQAGKIIKLTEEGEADEEKVDQNGEPVFKISKSRMVYRWNGAQATPVK